MLRRVWIVLALRPLLHICISNRKRVCLCSHLSKHNSGLDQDKNQEHQLSHEWGDTFGDYSPILQEISHFSSYLHRDTKKV